MALGISKGPLPGDYDVLGKVPVKIVSREDVEIEFLKFEELVLQPLVSQQPAALLRAGFDRQ